MTSLKERIRRELANQTKRAAVANAARGVVVAKWKQWSALKEQGRLQDLRDRARDAKNRALDHNAEYLAQFTRAVQESGGQVHFAATAAEAVAHVVAIAKRHEAKLVVKSKSMATEEIHLNQALADAGIETVETDLGEYIIQLAQEAPSHIVAPALHMNRFQVVDLFARHHGTAVSSEPEALTAEARRVLREKFLTAEIGITGANFGIAETGTVVLFTNEGNGRMVSSLPRVTISVMGIEKLVPTWAELEPLLTLLPRTATGQNMSVYVSFLTGPRREGELDGPEEYHVIVLDNGRSKILGTPKQDVLRCIRCGACLDACPVFRQIGGGHGYGTVYSGPIGVALTPLLKGMEQAGDLLDVCSMCGACTETCPVQIPLHELIRAGRAERPVSPWERRLFKLWAWAWSRPGRYRGVSRLLRWAAKPFTRSGYLTWTPGPLAPWGEGRDFPAPAARPLHQRWVELQKEVAP